LRRIQASINHAEIAGGIEETLVTLVENMQFWDKLVREHGDSSEIRRCIIELYVIVFELLTEVFTHWSKSSWTR
jgi:hypothetical protein